VTDIDRNTYRVVRIGAQVWMAENLKVSCYADGTPIPFVEDMPTWGDLNISEKAYCYYNYDTVYGETYGALYSWPAAMNGEASSNTIPSGVQGVCPAGWHLPSDEEWKVMEMSLGMTQEQADSMGYRALGIGGAMKSTGQEYWKDPNVGATNTSGFSALPGGHVNDAGYAYNRTLDCYFWSTTDSGQNEIMHRKLWYEYSKVLRANTYWYGDGFSVRCVKDD